MTEPQDSEPVEEAIAESEFRIPTLFRYLIGNRTAIKTAAASRHTLLLGGLLVLSAGFAREYDGEDLLREPWHLLIPHAASLGTSLLLYMMFALPTAFWQGKWKEFAAGYPTFLGLFWLTAPLAWLYAIPVERFLSAAGATQCNLCMLGIVSVWRVWLIIRVIATVYKPEAFRAVVITVLVFGDAVMLTAMHFVPVPILRVMGGVRLTDTEGILQGTKFLLMLAGFPLFVILGISYACWLVSPGILSDLPPVRKKNSSITRKVWSLTAASLLVWFVFLPMTQPPQQKRRFVERAIQRKDFTAAVGLMAKHQQDDFPRHWSPPPHVAFPNQTCEVSEVLKAIVDLNITGWARAVYLQKFKRRLQEVFRFDYRERELVVPYVELMTRIPPAKWADEIDGYDYMSEGLRDLQKKESLLSPASLELVDKALDQLSRHRLRYE